jgi:predicted DNA binding protein
MIPIVDITVPADSFELGRLLEELPGVHVELERIAPLRNSLLPLFWVSNVDEDRVIAILEESPLTDEVRYLTGDGERKLFEVRWSLEVNGLVQAMRDTDARLLGGESVGKGWDFRLQFPKHDKLDVFRDQCDENGIPIVLRRIYHPRYPRDGNPMTAAQQEAVLAAYEQGYFEVPRKVSMNELAAAFEISDSAYSQRLRRGLSTLIYETMIEG